MTSQSSSFGPFVLDTARGVLRRDGQPVALGQRAMALLQALLEADGAVVTKAALMDRGWPDTFVEEANLTVQIAALRKLLCDRPDGEEWIVTVPRIGYRLVTAGPARIDAALPGWPALAVLPFVNLGSDPEQDYFADGVVDDILTALSRFKSFSVIARTSSFVYKERRVDVRQVAQELGVRYVVEGSVRRAGNRLRIAAQLVDGVSGAHLWARNFDGTLDDVFDFQDEITESVATLVEPQIQAAEIRRSRRERPGSVATYDIYLQAQAKIAAETEGDNAEAYALLEKGLELEPNNALLLGLATWAIEHRNTMGWRPFGPDDIARCAELARRALDNAEGDAMVMAHCAMALLQTLKDYDWAMALIEAAVHANPNNLMVVVRAGVANAHCGSLDDALTYLDRANRLSPGEAGAHFSRSGIAHVQLILGNYEEARVWATRALASNPNFDPALWMLIAANAHLGRLPEAAASLERLKKLSPDVTIARIKAGQPAKDPSRFAAILDGLRLAGLEEG